MTRTNVHTDAYEAKQSDMRDELAELCHERLLDGASLSTTDIAKAFGVRRQLLYRADLNLIVKLYQIRERERDYAIALEDAGHAARQAEQLPA